MSEKRESRTKIEGAGKGGAFVTIPFDVENAFGKKRVKVRALIDGVPYRGSLVRMGGPQHLLGVLKEIRERVGKGVGDEVTVEVEEDTEEREVPVPDDLRAALAQSPVAAAAFDRLSYSHRREYVRWIQEAKRAPTRAARIEKTIRMLTKPGA